MFWTPFLYLCNLFYIIFQYKPQYNNMIWFVLPMIFMKNIYTPYYFLSSHSNSLHTLDSSLYPTKMCIFNLSSRFCLIFFCHVCIHTTTKHSETICWWLPSTPRAFRSNVSHGLSGDFHWVGIHTSVDCFSLEVVWDIFPLHMIFIKDNIWTAYYVFYSSLYLKSMCMFPLSSTFSFSPFFPL